MRCCSRHSCGRYRLHGIGTKEVGLLVSKGETEDAKRIFRQCRIGGRERGYMEIFLCTTNPQIQTKLTEIRAVGSQQEGHGVLFRHPMHDFNTIEQLA